jgi:putative ABC transport system permease protein
MSRRTGIARFAGELIEGFRISLGALFANRLRSLLTTLGIVIGVSTVIAIVAIIQGLNRGFEAQIASLGANTLYVNKSSWLQMNSEEWWSMRNRRPIGRPELQAIERESLIARAVAPMARARTPLAREGRELTGFKTFGTNDRWLETGGSSVQAGRFLTPGDLEQGQFVAVIGTDVLDSLFSGYTAEEAVGQRFLIGGNAFRVIGVMERRGRLMGSPMDDMAIIPLSTFTQLFGNKRSLQIAVSGPPDELSALEDELIGILRKARRVPPGQPDDFALNRQDQFIKFYQRMTGALYGVAIGLGIITLVVGGIGIMNIMLVSVRERTREIGVRRALGARRGTILSQFLLEASFVSALGGALGTGLGLGAAKLVSWVTPLAAAVTSSAVVLGIGFSAAVGLLFGAWPAWRAAQLDPAEALRYE